MTTAKPKTKIVPPMRLHVDYMRYDAGLAPGADVLAVIGFGDRAALPGDPRSIHVGLEPLHAGGRVEVWRGSGSVKCKRDGEIRYACDSHVLFGMLEIDEHAHGDIAGAAKHVYATIRSFQQTSSYPHLLRMWNYFDSINAGVGDAERYKQFCVGRSAALEGAELGSYPAATAIGRRDGERTLQVYWLAAKKPGRGLENPRQVSAFNYPREYGPKAPSFSRAMVVEERALLISGTASVVGHESHHPGDVLAQLEETLANLDSLLANAALEGSKLAPTFGPHSLLKVYLRDASKVDAIEAALRMRLPPATPFLVLAADICRADLEVEIDVTHLA